MTWFDEARLDDDSALGTIDLRLRHLAESGSRVRREVGDASGADGSSDEETALAMDEDETPLAERLLGGLNETLSLFAVPLEMTDDEVTTQAEDPSAPPLRGPYLGSSQSPIRHTD